ncbi:hypothetical protein FVE85_0858 [Porphyridium purpureum]|uniref:Uncharacterized protein n=1 Tax=Porphyridium purpureum TaxID=35688 RepID=A0A5J4YZS7_PORPP|nr:hypothetical protein FVE85_0858 [Porphyridium purpureum]|eukprot:POR1301..scf208_2
MAFVVSSGGVQGRACGLAQPKRATCSSRAAVVMTTGEQQHQQLQLPHLEREQRFVATRRDVLLQVLGVAGLAGLLGIPQSSEAAKENKYPDFKKYTSTENKWVLDKVDAVKAYMPKVRQFETMLKSSESLDEDTALMLKRYAAIYLSPLAGQMSLAVEQLGALKTSKVPVPERVNTLALAMKGHYAELTQALRGKDRTASLREVQEVIETAEEFLNAPVWKSL